MDPLIFQHPPGISYCPQCHRVRENGSPADTTCSRYGTWASHLYSMVQFGPNVYQDYCCVCLSKVNCKKKFGRVAPFDDFPFEEQACKQCRNPEQKKAPPRLRRAWSVNPRTPALI